MKRGTKIGLAVVMIILVMGLGVTGWAKAQASAPIVWKMNTWYPVTNHMYPHLEWAVNEISKRSNGRLKLDIYPGFSLGFKPRTWFRDHKRGMIDISELFNLYTLGEEPSFCVIEADYLFKNREQSLRALKALSDYKKRRYKDVWNSELIATGVNQSSTAVICTRRKQVRSIDDLKGLKLRVAGSRTKEVLADLGAAPQFMPKTEVYMALKTGVIDGFTSGWASLYKEKLYEVFDYSVLVGTSPALQEDIVVSPRVWEPLPTDLKQIVRNVFGAWAEKTKQSALSGKIGREDRDLLEKAGVRCTELSKEDMDKIRKMTLKLQADWVKSKGGHVAEAWEIVKPIVTE